MSNELNQLPAATLEAFAANQRRKATPTYPKWLAEVKDNLRYGDNSPSAVVQRRTNEGKRIEDALWEQVLREAGE